MKQLLLLLNTIHPVSNALKEFLEVNMKSKPVSRKDILLREGEICKNLYFVESGLLRCYYFKNEQEVSSWFMREGNFLVSVESFYSQIPSYETIHALEDSKVFYMSYEKLQYAYNTFQEFNFIGRILTERYYALSEQRLYSLRMQKSSDRYLHLLKTAPELISRVPSQFLATYLGMRNETLSRIKTKYRA